VTCTYSVSLTRLPLSNGNMHSVGTVRCSSASGVYSVALYLTAPDASFDGVNLCAACGSFEQRRSGSGTKDAHHGGRHGTWTACLAWQGDGSFANNVIRCVSVVA
jgi:hypothetical protein